MTGGIYMMWPSYSLWFSAKNWCSNYSRINQACISLLIPFGNFGLLSFVIYLAPGIAIDGFLIRDTRHCCSACCVSAAAIANVVGTVLVGTLVLLLPLSVLSFGRGCSNKRLYWRLNRKYASNKNHKNRS